MQSLSTAKALNQALLEEMDRDSRIFLFGEDVGVMGGRHGVTKGLLQKFGKKRVIDMPLNEDIFIAIAIGAAQTGLIPIVEFTHMNLLMIAMSDLYQAGIWRSANAGKISIPMVIRTTFGTSRFLGPETSGDYLSLFYNIPGIKIVAPSRPFDAYTLLKAAIREQNPVVFLEHAALYDDTSPTSWKGPGLSMGKIRTVREGRALTVITYGVMAKIAEQTMKAKGIDAEILDLASLKPLDMHSILVSVRKTRKVLIIEEGFKGMDLASMLSYEIREKCGDIPTKTLAANPIPLPFGSLAKHVLPDEHRIAAAVQALL